MLNIDLDSNVKFNLKECKVQKVILEIYFMSNLCDRNSFHEEAKLNWIIALSLSIMFSVCFGCCQSHNLC